jgi:hypothetical protein
MTRIEPQNQNPTAQRSVAGNFVKPVLWLFRLPFKITFRFLVLCAFIFLLVEVTLTGIWDIPVLSKALYRQPEPIRQVTEQPFSLSLFRIQTEEKLIETSRGIVDVTLSEDQLTSLLRDVFLSESAQPFGLGQLAIEQSHMQFFGNLKARPQVYITADLTPEVSDKGVLRVRVNSVSIGHVRVPQVFVSGGITSFLGSTLMSKIFAGISVSGVSAQHKQLILQGVSL